MRTGTIDNILQEQLNDLIPLKGFSYTIMVDSRINFLLAAVPPQEDIDVDELTVQASAIVQADIATSTAIGIPDETESIVFTSDNEVRIFYKLHSIDNYVFIMLVLRKTMCNVALALHQLRRMEPKLKL